jgi:excinuclease ABC subunit A
LHQRDNDRLIKTLKQLRDHGNTVIVVEHDLDTIRKSDYVIDMGPASGEQGGQVIASGTPRDVAKDKNSITGAYLSGRREICVPEKRRKPSRFVRLEGAHTNNLKKLNVDIPLDVLCAISGVSGSGKSSLIVQTLAPALQYFFRYGYRITGNFKTLEGIEQIKNMVVVDQSPIGRTPRSNPATYLGIFNDIRNLYSSLPESNARGYKPGQFSFNVAQGRCFECRGEGLIRVPMHFLEDVMLTCKSCNGKRYNNQTLEIFYKEKNIADILDMSACEALEFFANFPTIAKRLKFLCDVGLDYIKLGQSSKTLSGGEAQRIKLVNELAKRGKNTLYILDEPTTGLHSCDIEKLLSVLNRLVDIGNSVWVIEHNLDVLKSADYIVDVGPDGGDEGGKIVVRGTPEKVTRCKKSHTGKYLKELL